MKALSIRQPWAWAIACGAKTAENRSRRTHYRGLVAIHASRQIDRPALDSPLILAAIADRGFEIDEATSTTGAIVAVAWLTDCHSGDEKPPCSPWGWSGPDNWHWVLTGVRALAEPVPCRGALGLWTVPDDVAVAVDAQLPAHACPPDGGALMPCCNLTPFEVPRTDRMTLDRELVTCTGELTSR